ncbi:unnamed protein product [marine sediment metagenome]|uniref:Uncharacterized protein n=1 Tax=marine sediment metagenome TaxID=412755 RepID=X1UJA3_9ZZZZ
MKNHEPHSLFDEISGSSLCGTYLLFYPGDPSFHFLDSSSNGAGFGEEDFFHPEFLKYGFYLFRIILRVDQKEVRFIGLFLDNVEMSCPQSIQFLLEIGCTVPGNYTGLVNNVPSFPEFFHRKGKLFPVIQKTQAFQEED